MTSRLVAVVTAAAAVIGLTACAPSAPRGIVLISVDTLRADRLGCYGDAHADTPHLDALAARGALFENAFVQLPGTLPSHMCLFTGLYPQEHGVFPPDGVLAPEVPTLPEVLQRAGWRTAGFTEGGYVSGRYGFARGFDVFDDSAAHIPSDVERTFARGLRFIDSVPSGAPFFVFLHTYAVHDPYFPPPAYLAGVIDDPAVASASRFEDADGSVLTRRPAEPTKADGEALQLTHKLILEHAPPGAFPPTGPEFSRYNRSRGPAATSEVRDFYSSLYDAGVSYLDDVLGGFLAGLRQRGLEDRVLVVVTADHGEEFLEHGRFVHEQAYRECLHVPLIVAGPGAGAGRRVGQVVESVDVAPTLLDVAGVQEPPPMSGTSRRPLLASGGSAVTGEAYAEGFVEPQRTVIEAREGHLFHLVTLGLRGSPDGAWVSRALELDLPGRRLSFRAASFHEPREVKVSVDGEPLTTLALVPAWKDYSLDLQGSAGDGVHHIVLTTPGCTTPRSVGVGPEDVCLSFKVLGLPMQRLELFDMSADPAEQVNLAGRDRSAMVEMLDRLAGYHFQSRAPRQTAPLDEEVAAQLRALGYIQ